MKTAQDWQAFCEEHITAGFTPGSSKAAVYTRGVQMAQALWEAGVIFKGADVLDFGCGNGSLAFGLLDYPIASYTGIDVVAPCIEFCKLALSGYGYTFRHIDMQNTRYWVRGAGNADIDSYNLEQKAYDVIVANSLFSHTATVSAAMNAINQIKRALRKGGMFYSTWFLTEERGEITHDARKTVYLRSHVETMLGPNAKQQVIRANIKQTEYLYTKE